MVARVSVVIPTYNQEEFVCEAVESALAQTFADVEVIVVDDGSTDGTPRRLQPYGNRIRYLRKENGGPSSALNVGIRAATGEFFAWLSSDDVFYPQKIERQVACLESDPAVGLVYTDFEVVQADGSRLYQFESPLHASRQAAAEALLSHCFINGSTVMMRMACFDRIGLFDERYRQGQDYDMWLRVLSQYDFGHVPEILLRYRWHWKNLSQQVEPRDPVPEIQAKGRKLLGL